MTCDDIYALMNDLAAIANAWQPWEYHAARHCPIPPTEQELDHYVRTGQHPLRPSPSLRIW